MGAALLAGDPRVGLDPGRVTTLSVRAGNAGVARLLARQPTAAPPKPAVTPVAQVKHTFTIPDKKLGSAKDLGYAQAQFEIGANVDLEITPFQASTAPGAPAGDVTLKGSGGMNAGDGTKYQAEVTAEFGKARRRNPRRLHPQGEGQGADERDRRPQQVSVEELMTELRGNAARDFCRIHAQTRQEVFSH